MKNNSIPILYYHSVANHDEFHPWSFLSVDINTFKAQLKYLSLRGYRTCNWLQLNDHLQGKKKLPKKTVFFHFDDGFLDNWTVVFPLMKKYNFQYSVLITPEFVEKNGNIRPFVQETSSNNRKNWWGYLSEGEIKKMSSSGLVDFQCHGYTHTWYESSEQVIDFFDGTQFIPYLNWNKHPILKPFWLTRFDEMTIPIGTPIFTHEKSLALKKAFLPNKKFVEECISSVENNGYSKERLFEIYLRYKRNKNLGSYENNEKSAERLQKELQSTKHYIESLTGKDANYIVFPGGGNNSEIIELSKKLGFKLISKGIEFNKYDSKIFQIKRAAGFHDFGNKRANIPLNLLMTEFQLQREHGNPIINFLIKKFR